MIVVNDNGRSYTPTIGGLASRLRGLGQQRLSAIRTDRRYERSLAAIKRWVSRTPVVGEPTYGLMHGVKAGVKDVLAPQGMYSDLASSTWDRSTATTARPWNARSSRRAGSPAAR